MPDENPTIHRSLSNNPKADLAGGGPHFEPSAERYRVIEEIARGGMGRILKVYDNDLRRYVAMKVVRAPEGLDAYQLQKFVEEAQISAQLQHPCIVPTYEVGTDAGGSLYYTMKLVEGRSLSQVIRALKDGAESMSELKRLQTLQCVAQALGYAHAKGVVHRDLKPDNIMLGRHGEILVIDWGLARVMGRAPSSTGSIVTTKRSENDSTQTLDGTIAGTPVYMAPEQAEGRMEDIEPRTDVYALGAILYHWLTLQQPVVGRELRELLDNVARGIVREVPKSVPRELAAVIRRAMALDPKDRYPTAEAFADDLQAYIEGRRGEAWSDNPLTLAAKWVRRHRAPAAVGVAALATIVALVVWQRTRPGSIDLDSNPIGAGVWIDGERAGTTPLHGRRLAAGEHEVTLKLPVHHDAVQRIHVGAGAKAEYVFNMRPRFGVLSLTSDPIGAEVFITTPDGRTFSAGRTPIAETLDAGEHRLRLALDRHVDLETTVRILDGGEMTRRHVELEINAGRLRIPTEQPGVTARVARDGEAIAEVTLPRAEPIELEPGRYALTLSLDGHVPWSGAVDVERDRESRAGAWLPSWEIWSVDLGAAVQAPPTLSDLDADGVVDAVVALDDGNVAVVSGADGSVLWKRRMSVVGAMYRPLMHVPLADVDGDGVDDCMFTVGTRLYAASGRTGAEIWAARTAGAFAGPLLTDVDGDGTLDALLAATNAVQAFSGRDGRLLWETPVADPGLKAAGALSADFNGDGVADVAALLSQGAPAIFSGKDGSMAWHLPLQGDALTMPMGAADLDADGTPDLVVWEAAEAFVAYSGADGRVLWRSEGAYQNLADAALADFDGDGAADCAVATVGSVHVLSGRSGRPLWRSAHGMSGNFLALGDIDGDGTPDLVVNGPFGGIVVFSGSDGKKLWTIDLKEPALGGTSLADLDGDGRLDLVYGTAGGRLVAVSPAASRIQWTVRALNTRAIADLNADLDADGLVDAVVLTDPAPGIVEARSGHDGSLLWASSPWEVLSEQGADGVVFAANEERLAALSARDGTPRWSVEIDARPDQLLVPGDGTVVRCVQVARGEEIVFSYAVHAIDDGRPIRDGGATWPKPVVHLGAAGSDAAAGDFDGDGRADLAVLQGLAEVRVLSEAGGWKATLNPAGGVGVQRIDDLDGDGAPDVLVRRTDAILAFAGRDGRPLWKAAAFLYFGTSPVTADVDGDGRPDVIGGGLRAFCASGADGERLWMYPRGGAVNASQYGTPAVVGPDAVIPAPAGFVCAVDAADGTERWRVKMPDGDVRIVGRMGDRALAASTHSLTALRLDTGRNRWIWHGGVGRDFTGGRVDAYDGAREIARAEAAYDGRRNAALLARADAIENLASDPAVRRRAALLAAKLAAHAREFAAAVTWLERAADHGFDDAAALEADETFEKCRRFARFERLLRRMRER